jgi:catecholate siderophore receptor
LPTGTAFNPSSEALSINMAASGLGAQYVDLRYNSVANTRAAPDYWVYEASASYVVSDSLNFRLNLQNATDEQYIDFVGGGYFIPGMEGC